MFATEYTEGADGGLTKPRLAAVVSVCFRAFRFFRGEERFVFFRGFRG
jgi:hypothetical protein